MKLRSAQKKGLSEFLNTIAAAWFTAGVISPLFLDLRITTRNIVTEVVSLGLAGLFLVWSLQLLERIR